MTQANHARTPVAPHVALQTGGWQRAMGPFLVAALVVVGLAILVVLTSRSAWYLLGAGRGLVAPTAYPLTALVLVLGTTFGQFVGWAVGSALLVYVWYLLGSAITLRVIQVSMSMVYCGLVIVPIFFYHFLFGQPLAGLPRPGVADWVRQNYPDAYWLLFTGHMVVDLLVLPLLIAVLVLTWKGGERLLRHRGLQTLVLLLILLTSFAVALSLAIHSAQVHIRLGA